MENCEICLTPTLVVKTSSAGRETYCTGCRRIMESASLGFKFAVVEGDDDISTCTTADNRKGWKGPGKRARCWAFEEGKKEGPGSEQEAIKKAKDSAYAAKRSRGASRVIHAVGYFTGAEGMSSPTGGSPMGGASQATPGRLHGSPVLPGGNPTNPMAPGPQSNPVPPTAHPGKNPMQPGPLIPGGSGVHGEVPAAPGGIQPGNLNSSNPANSGTTASKVTPRLAELISKELFGDGYCTKHDCPIDVCKSEHELH